MTVGVDCQAESRRNATAVSDAAAVPLTDVADLNNQADDAQSTPMPELKFQYDGNPKTMRSYIVEPGAVAPPAAQQQQTTTNAAAGGGAPPKQ